MSLIEVNWNPNRRELRQFALLWTAFFAIMGAIALWAKHSPTTATVCWCIAPLGLVGALLPAAVRPVYITWMALALPIGWVVSHVLLLAIYWLVFTPIGLLIRATGKDPMSRGFEKNAATYWLPRAARSNATDYFKQH